MAKRKDKAGAEPTTGAEPSVRLSSGETVPLDGDLVFLIDRLYREFSRQHGFAPDYGDLQRELHLLIAQMDSSATVDYLTQSLFLNYVTYENEMADRLAEQLAQRRDRATRRSS